MQGPMTAGCSEYHGTKVTGMGENQFPNTTDAPMATAATPPRAACGTRSQSVSLKQKSSQD